MPGIENCRKVGLIEVCDCLELRMTSSVSAHAEKYHKNSRKSIENFGVRQLDATLCFSELNPLTLPPF